MNQATESGGASLLDCLPASVELPAGSGKTWLLADTVREVANRDGRCLVLTHTNAGVHAVKAKLDEFNVRPAVLHIATITSFAFELVGSYSRLAGAEVPEIPDWDKSADYIEAATRVVANRHIAEVLSVSFTHLLVDEYQDCSKLQHSFVLALTKPIPAAVIFGDPMQGIFGFRDPIVDWSTDIVPKFPPYDIPNVPRRWEGHNEALGAWLVSARALLQPGTIFDLATGRDVGVTFMQATPRRFELMNAALQQRAADETVVIVAPSDRTSARVIASKLKGAYSTMEEIAGSFMAGKLADLTDLTPDRYAHWLALLTKDCFVGYGSLDATLLRRLEKGKTVSGLSRPGLQQTLAVFDRVIATQTYESVTAAMADLRTVKEARLHSHEAWGDIAGAIEACSQSDERNLVGELSRLRERIRRAGRRPQRRVVSRTALIKGLEYDHVIIADIDRIADCCNLYVALTRARKSVTVIGRSMQITVTETKRAPTPRRAK